MTDNSSPPPGPPPKFWDTLPQIVGKLSNEFLLVTLGILILVVAIGRLAPNVVKDLGAAFFYLLVVLAWLAYLFVRVLDVWVKLRTSPGSPAPAPSQGEELQQAGQSQTAPDSQTIIENSQGPVLSGTFSGPVSVGAAATPSSGTGQRELDRLHQTLATRFDREELRTLCFGLGVAYDDLRGEGHSAQARELVTYMNRRGELERLRAAIRAARP
jgi:hypothetical protein